MVDNMEPESSRGRLADIAKKNMKHNSIYESGGIPILAPKANEKYKKANRASATSKMKQKMDVRPPNTRIESRSMSTATSTTQLDDPHDRDRLLPPTHSPPPLPSFNPQKLLELAKGI